MTHQTRTLSIITGICTLLAHQSHANDTHLLAFFDAADGSGAQPSEKITDFDNIYFDSHGHNSAIVTTSRLNNAGSLNGGGASDMLVMNSWYNNSHDTGYNFGNVNTTSQIDASNNNTFFSFTTTAIHPDGLQYSNLNFSSNQHSTTSRIDVSYTIEEAPEVFLANGLIPATSSSTATNTGNLLDGIDLQTYKQVTWTFYLYGAPNNTSAIRPTDISLEGSIVPEPSTYAFLLGIVALCCARMRRRHSPRDH